MCDTLTFGGTSGTVSVSAKSVGLYIEFAKIMRLFALKTFSGKAVSKCKTKIPVVNKQCLIKYNICVYTS